MREVFGFNRRRRWRWWHGLATSEWRMRGWRENDKERCIAGWQGCSCDNALKEAKVYLRFYSEVLILKSIYGELITQGRLKIQVWEDNRHTKHERVLQGGKRLLSLKGFTVYNQFQLNKLLFISLVNAYWCGWNDRLAPQLVFMQVANGV